MINTNQKAHLIIGADGLISQALSNYLRQKGEFVLETTRRKNSVSDTRFFLDLREDISNWHPPDNVSVAYICASANSLEQCKRFPEQTSRVNVKNTIKIAKKLVENGIFVIFPSTNLVCDGFSPFQKSSAPTNPQTEHGRQKAETEKNLLSLGNLISVVRFTKVFGPNIPLLQEWILNLKKNKSIHPFSDKVVSPLSLSFVIQVLYKVAKQHLQGIIQVSAEKDITYAEIGFRIAEKLGVNSDLVQPIESKKSNIELETIEAHTTLDTERLISELNMKPANAWSTIDNAIEKNTKILEEKI